MINEYAKNHPLENGKVERARVSHIQPAKIFLNGNDDWIGDGECPESVSFCVLLPAILEWQRALKRAPMESLRQIPQEVILRACTCFHERKKRNVKLGGMCLSRPLACKWQRFEEANIERYPFLFLLQTDGLETSHLRRETELSRKHLAVKARCSTRLSMQFIHTETKFISDTFKAIWYKMPLCTYKIMPSLWICRLPTKSILSETC